MAIITFKSNSLRETGNTSTAIAVATYMSIEHNMKILLISTSFNEDTVKESFWDINTKKNALDRKNSSTIQTGIDGLSRIISSSKIEPRLIKDYTNVVLTGRLDVLLGYNGEKAQYKIIQENYQQVISVASQYYDMVIVDLDKKLSQNIQMGILQISDIIVTTTSQKVKELQALNEYINEGNIVNQQNTIPVIGKYDDDLKCNIKNATRSIFRRRKLINTIPYNGKYYEAMQEGMVLDLFLNLLRLKNKRDQNYLFIQEVKRLTEDINERWEEVRMKRNM